MLDTLASYAMIGGVKKKNINSARTTPTSLASLKRRLVEAGITQRAVAERRRVTTVHVCNVLAGRITSAPVIATVKEMLAEVAC